MITVAMPVGSTHGWGVCGKYISREMAALTQMRLVTAQMTLESVGDELEFQALNQLLYSSKDASGVPSVNGLTTLPHPLLTCIVDKSFNAWMPQLRGTPTVGYTFFEENILQRAWIDAAARSFQTIVTGSSWCTQVLKGYGLVNVHTVLQGVDPRIFFPWPAANALPDREFLKDRFVIFSGGKFELRKGQDIVIRAVKVMQDRHPDVALINAWYNPWQETMHTMRSSPYLRWPAASGNYIDVMNRLLAENGLDLSRVITLGPRPNALMARIYRNTDLGLFPNRCEGGTNLVLMEYMATGKPVVAVNATGHGDVVRDSNALVIRIKSENTLNGPSGPIARWPEPDLDDTIDKLEFAYTHREQTAALAAQAATDLAALTWTKTAADFLKILTAN